MNHRPRYRRAFSSLSVIALVALSAVTAWIIGFRNNAEWAGVALGASEAQVIDRLGEPDRRFDTSSVIWLSYPDVDVWFRDDAVVCIQIRGNPDQLHTEACLRYGIPINTEGGNIDWNSGRIIARLYQNELTVSLD